VKIAWFGSSLSSSYWNGAATYYRGLVSALYERGHVTTFFEPDAFDRQAHRDLPCSPWANVVVYQPEDWEKALELARDADVVVKASGVGVNDPALAEGVLSLCVPVVVFWDVDAPATLSALEADADDPLIALLPRYDVVLTYGGGRPVVDRYQALGARACIPVYNALDPKTHHPVKPDSRFRTDLAFLGNRLPDREARVEEFFLRPAGRSKARSFLLGGAGWDDLDLPANVRYVGHVPTGSHNALNATALAVLNLCRESMAQNGWSPATRVFEAAGAGACVITDEWNGIEIFLEPGEEILVANDGFEVLVLLESLTPVRAAAIGERARQRLVAEHTYAKRAKQVEAVLEAARP
jgi:spore maturation protein CgeB